MPRIRTVKPEFWTNEKLSRLPEVSHMTAAALLNYADDEGYFNANPGLIKAAIFPLRDPSRSVPVVLHDLSSVGYLQLGTGSDGRCYGHIINFDAHQKINKKTNSKIKPLQIEWSDSGSAPGLFPEPSLTEGNREQGKEQGRESTPRAPRAAPAPPKQDYPQIPEAVQRWAAKKGYAPYLDLHHEHFRDYLSNRKGKPYPNLDAAFRNCVRADWGDVRRNASREGKINGTPRSRSWWETALGIEAKGVEYGLDVKDFTAFPYFRDEVLAEARKRDELPEGAK